LKKECGERVWPDFAEAEIPVILYDRDIAFLVGLPDPPAPWAAVEGDSFQGRPYFLRLWEDPQAFAVPVGGTWAASLDTLKSMNESMEEQIRRRLPPEKVTPSMIKMVAVTPAQHLTALLHEAFHAFQADRDPDRFRAAQSVYRYEARYPGRDDLFRTAWDEEGAVLASALRSRDDSEAAGRIRTFLNLRRLRRFRAGLDEGMVTFERELEWLEGLGKYVEMRFAEEAASSRSPEEAKDFRVARSRLSFDFFGRLPRLGNQEGDLRFYLSGAAQAMLLDRIASEWKRTIMRDARIGLEDLLEAAIGDSRRDEALEGGVVSGRPVPRR
jgi:hypothetical protein